MEKLINLDSFVIQSILPILLSDRTTGKNIIWATSNYSSSGDGYGELDEVTIDKLKSIDIQPRVLKTKEVQKSRSKKRAEVFTPSWICNMMNNHCDEQWFGRLDVFNIQTDKTWKSNDEKIEFENVKGKTWQDYVLSTRLEITCGEAPYLASRYDTTTGELICVSERIGMLDRKLRVVNENTITEEEWFEWVVKSYQSIYGYEFQGDNLLIARMNLILTFVDYMKCKWDKEPTKEQLEKIATIISWNIWQMDGLNYTIPLCGQTNGEKVYAKIIEWGDCNSANILYFKDLLKADS